MLAHSPLKNEFILTWFNGINISLLTYQLYCILKLNKMFLSTWFWSWKTKVNLLYYVFWRSRSVKTRPPSSASVSVCDSCCLSCCHWSQAASCKPLISVVFPRLIIASVCLYKHIQYIYLESTPKHLSISCQTHTHLGFFFFPLILHAQLMLTLLSDSCTIHLQTYTHDGQTEWRGREIDEGGRRGSWEWRECRKAKKTG